MKGRSNMGISTARVESALVFCGSSNRAAPEFLADAADLGRGLAAAGIRLVYGGGGVGLMGACARACHESGGRVLGVMPNFLRAKEILYDEVETIVVENMHQRKNIMFEQSDVIVVLPGGIGTLEEIVELMSWKRLALHDKPIIFVNIGGYWELFFQLMRQTVDHHFTPEAILSSWVAVDNAAGVIAALEAMRLPDDTDQVEDAVNLT